MDKIKNFLVKHLEKILVLGLTGVILITNYFVFQKMAFLNFYYLPVLVFWLFLREKIRHLYKPFQYRTGGFPGGFIPELFLSSVNRFKIDFRSGDLGWVSVFSRSGSGDFI